MKPSIMSALLFAAAAVAAHLGGRFADLGHEERSGPKTPHVLPPKRSASVVAKGKLRGNGSSCRQDLK